MHKIRNVRHGSSTPILLFVGDTVSVPPRCLICVFLSLYRRLEGLVPFSTFGEDDLMALATTQLTKK